MDPVLVVTLAAAAVVVVLSVVLVAVVAVRRRLEQELLASRAELVALERRLDGLTQGFPPPPAGPDRPGDQDYLITSLVDRPSPARGERSAEDPTGLVHPLTGREFASVALAESLVRAISVVHGVRRATSAENRNRIRFEMGREVKRARQSRRRELKDARRHLRAQQTQGRTGSDTAEDAA